MTPQPIETAPRDGTKIFAYGSYAWETLENHDTRGEKGWLVVYWDPELTWNWETDEAIGGWKSVTGNPYVDYMIAEKWLPIPEE